LSNADDDIERKIALLAVLQGTPQFEDEKIDIVVKPQGSTFEMPIYEVAKHECVQISRQKNPCEYILPSANCMQRCLKKGLSMQDYVVRVPEGMNKES
jgi:hypothetical protein